MEGEKELFLNMQKSLDGSLKAARQGLRKAGMQIIADSVQNIRNNGSWTGGQLAQSGRVQKVEGDADSIDVGFFSKDSKNGYAYYVEYGRRSGKMPPPQDLIPWLRKKNKTKGAKSALKSMTLIMNARARKHKNRTPEDLLLMAATALAFHIGKKGTKPHPFFNPAVKKNESAITQAIADAVKQEIK